MPSIITTNGVVAERHKVKEGTSLYDFMLSQHPESKNFPAPTVAVFQGNPVLRKEWETITLTGDEVAVFVAVPMGGGGGSNPLSIIITIASVALAVYTGGLIAGEIGGFGGALLGGLASGGILAAGGLLAGALASNRGLSMGHMDSQKNEASSPTYSLNANTNQMRLLQPLGSLFGRMKIVPDVGSQPYSMYASSGNNEMYLHQVFACGLGRFAPEKLGFGDIYFWEKGHLIDSAYTRDDEQHNVSVNVSLVHPNLGGEWSEPVAVVSPFASTKSVSFTLHFPHGLCAYEFIDAHFQTYTYINEKGRTVHSRRWVVGRWGQKEHTVAYTFQAREIDAKGEPLGEWKDFISGSETKQTEEAFTITVQSPRLSTYARYEVRGCITSQGLGTIEAYETQQGSVPPLYRSIEAREALTWQSSSAIVASIQVQFVEPGEAVTLFPDNVYTSPSVGGQELKAPNQEGEWVGPFPVCEPGFTVTRIMNDIVFPRGLGWLNNKGNLQAYTVGWQFDYQPIDDRNNPIGERAPLNHSSISMATQQAQRRTLINDVPQGRYWVWARRSSNSNGDTRTIDTMQWESMKGVVPGTLKYEQSMIAISIRSTGLSVASSERFNVIGTRMLPEYDRKTKTWSEERPTRSFAAAVCHVCKAKYGGRLTDSQIDLDTLWTLDEQVREKGWYFDAWVDGAYSNWQLIVEICKTMNVIPQPAGAILSFTMDRAGRLPKHSFNPRSIVRNSLAPHYNTYDSESPDDVIVSYLDADAGFAKRDVRGSLPESESRQPSIQQPIGIVNRDHAFCYAMHLARANRFRRISIEFGTEGAGRTLNVGDVILVEHPRLQGRMTGVFTEWDASSLMLVADRELPSLDDEGYLAINQNTGGIWGPVKLDWADGNIIKLNAEDFSLLRMQGMSNPFAWIRDGVNSNPTTWTLMDEAEFQENRFLIRSIVPSGQHTFTITAVNDDPRVYEPYGETPGWDYGGHNPTSESLDVVKDIKGVFESTDSELKVHLTWGIVPGAGWYTVEHSTDGASWIHRGRSNVNAMTLSIGQGNVHIRIAASNDFMSGGWGMWQGNSDTLPPAQPTLSHEPYESGQAVIYWGAVARAKSYTVSIFAGSDVPVRIFSTTDTTYTYTLADAISDGGAWRALRIHVQAIGDGGGSPVAEIILTDVPPVAVKVDDVKVEVGAESMTLTSLVSLPHDATGYVIVQGSYAGFGLSDVVHHVSVDALPYEWRELEPDTEYYFRIAYKDTFTDVTGDYMGLMYSDSVSITTLGGDES